MSAVPITIVQPKLILEDPHNCTDMGDALTVLDAIYDGFVRRTDASYVPSLATSWEVAEEGRLWTFHLRQGVRFHNGEAFDAHAAAACLQRMARPDMGVTLGAPGVYAQYLKGAEITAADDDTVVVRLAAPMSDLLDLLVYGYMAAPSALEDPRANPIGTGPYRVVRADAEAIVAEANADHFDGPPRFASITWRAESDAAARAEALASGKASVANRLANGVTAGASHMFDYLAPTTIIYLFNTVSGPLADRRVRRALNLALDRDELVARVRGGAGTPLYGPLSPVHPGYRPPEKIGPDREGAMALLAEAGHGEGLTIKVDCPTSLPDEAVALTEEVGRQLRSVGVTLDVRHIEDREAYAHRVRRSEIRDMCVFDSSPLSTYRVLHEKIDSRSKGSWWLGYQNAEVEALIDEAARTVDRAARQEVFARCHKVLVEDPPWLTCYCEVRRIGLAMPTVDKAWTMRADGVIDVRALPALAPSR